MDPTLVPGTRFESQFQICVYEHAILRIYISFFFPTEKYYNIFLLVYYIWEKMSLHLSKFLYFRIFRNEDKAINFWDYFNFSIN